MQQFKKKICPSCQKEFIPKYNQRQKYCDSYRGGPKTCKTYASRIRTGKMEALAVVAVDGVGEGEPKTIEQKIQMMVKDNLDGMAQIYAIDKELEISIDKSIMEFNGLDMNKRSLSKEIRELKEELTEMEEFDESHLDESDLAQFRQEKQDVRNELSEAQIRFENEKRRMSELEIILPVQQVERFRVTERTRAFLKAEFANEKVLSLSDFKALSKFDVIYPFGELFESKDIDRQFYTSALGRLPQPFLVNIFGGKESGRTSVMLSLVKDFTNLFKAPVLYLIDFHILINDFWEIVDKKSINNQMDLLRVQNRMQITQTLAQKEYEFLVIDLTKSYNLNYKFISDLQKQYPRLSIFIISVNPLAEFSKSTHVIIEVRNGVGIPIKGGNDSRYIIGWENADHMDFYPPEEEEEEIIDYEETPMIPYNQMQPYQPHYDPNKQFNDMLDMMEELAKLFNK